MSELSISPEISPAVTEVEKFLTTVWQHPLLDQKTIDHRQQALTALPPFMERFSIDPSEYIGIPYGSFLWITDEASDNDYQIINFERFSGPGKFNDAEIYARKNPENKIHLSDMRGIDKDDPQLFLNHSHALGYLLFTPDEYLLGNVGKARELRLKVIDQLLADSSSLDLNWAGQTSTDTKYGTMQTFFDTYFKGWAQHQFTTRVGLMAGDEGRKRREDAFKKRSARLDHNLAERSAAVFDPEYKEHFMQAFAQLTIPSFSVYAEALRQEGGALHLNPRFAAQTIEEAREFKERHKG